MKGKIIALALVAASLAGCATAPHVWNHPSKTAADFNRDKTQCLYESKSQAAVAATPGYDGAIQAAIRKGSLENELANNCMFAKGYTLE